MTLKNYFKNLFSPPSRKKYFVMRLRAQPQKQKHFNPRWQKKGEMRECKPLEILLDILFGKK